MRVIRINTVNALPEQFASTTSAVSLASLHAGARGVIQRVIDDDSTLGEETGATIVMRLIEIGFVPGERFVDIHPCVRNLKRRCNISYP